MTCGERHEHLLNCPTCQALAQSYFAQRAGSTITEAKSKSSRENGKKGGRPPMDWACSYCHTVNGGRDGHCVNCGRKRI